MSNVNGIWFQSQNSTISGSVNERHKMFNGNHNKQANEKERKYWNCKVWTVQENGRQRASKRHAKVYLLRVFVVSWMVKCRQYTDW